MRTWFKAYFEGLWMVLALAAMFTLLAMADALQPFPVAF